ncbi:MAG: molecular chaperone HtpG [Rickettsiales bacterium]|nr:molecular chaperone HtpG [Rickettsiales bacterium]
MTETRKFGAEIGKVLNLMINSLYTNKDIFLRELLSNASDACDKLRYGVISDENLKSLGENNELSINIDLNKEKKQITITDYGIGMSKDELINNLGTIAKSGTEEFLKNFSGNNKKDVELIGQFGVGFYSGFIVADNISVISNKAGESDYNKWESNGQGEFTISTVDASEGVRGTKIILNLKAEEDKYLDGFTVKNIVKTYSDHIPFPITLTTDEEKPSVKEGEETVTQDAEIINSSKALWTKNKSSIKKEEYDAFYKSIAHAADEPHLVLHNKNEGVIEYTNLLFIPSKRPFDLFHPDRKTRVKLYVKKIFITEDNVNLIPAYLRFVQGIVDSEDLNLNISRETLQNNVIVDKIRTALVKRILSELTKLKDKKHDKYVEFWETFGAVVKEGLCEFSGEKDKIFDLCLFKTSKSNGKFISLKQYIENMQDGQKDIYYLIGSDLDSLQNNPQLEAFTDKNIEVLFLMDPVDDFWATTFPQYQEKGFKSLSRITDDLDDIGNKDEKSEKDTKAKNQKLDEELKDLKEFAKTTLTEYVADIRLSSKLTSSPVCLAIAEGAMDIRIERMMIEQGQLKEPSKKLLELNPNHKIIQNLNNLIKDENNKTAAADILFTLYDQACIIEGEGIKNPSSLAKRLTNLLEQVS